MLGSHPPGLYCHTEVSIDWRLRSIARAESLQVGIWRPVVPVGDSTLTSAGAVQAGSAGLPQGLRKGCVELPAHTDLTRAGSLPP